MKRGFQMPTSYDAIIVGGAGQWMTELIEGERQEETLQPFRVDRFSKTLITR
jgi:hypothetical protein